MTVLTIIEKSPSLSLSTISSTSWVTNRYLISIFFPFDIADIPIRICAEVAKMIEVVSEQYSPKIVFWTKKKHKCIWNVLEDKNKHVIPTLFVNVFSYINTWLDNLRLSDDQFVLGHLEMPIVEIFTTLPCIHDEIS